MVLDGSMKPGERTRIKQASMGDYEQIADFLNNHIHIHRHLDWISSLEWIGKQPFLLEIAQNSIIAMFCAVPDNEKVAWIRIFGVRHHKYVVPSWELLLSEAISQLRSMNINRLATLVLHPWFKKLVLYSEFEHLQDVIVLEWQGYLPEIEKQNDQIQIRHMQPEDLRAVTEIDHLAFSPLWQNTFEDFQKACGLSGIMTVATIKDQLVGYQISTNSAMGGHLARLAVLPEYQRMGIAFFLVHDLLEKFTRQECSKVTVNTQSDNKPSLALYHKFGFRKTAEEIPVYELNF
jgi:ribosomal-protein-alanine N-acetyltransferase